MSVLAGRPAACICTIAHEPSIIVAILPVPSMPLDCSQFVVVGSGSVSFPCTAS